MDNYRSQDSYKSLDSSRIFPTSNIDEARRQRAMAPISNAFVGFDSGARTQSGASIVSGRTVSGASSQGYGDSQRPSTPVMDFNAFEEYADISHALEPRQRSVTPILEFEEFQNYSDITVLFLHVVVFCKFRAVVLLLSIRGSTRISPVFMRHSF
jgi:hypothetical protein